VQGKPDQLHKGRSEEKKSEYKANSTFRYTRLRHSSIYAIILKEFAHTRYSLLYDSIAGRDIRVETHNGVPRCKSCKSNDCGHVGFTILLEQKYENDGVILD
jgi:hypothetical protein